MITGGFTGADNMHAEFNTALERAIVGEAIVGTSYICDGSDITGTISGSDPITGKLEEN